MSLRPRPAPCRRIGGQDSADDSPARRLQDSGDCPVPLKTSFIDTLRAASWGAVVRAVKGWSARAAYCKFLRVAVSQPSTSTVVPSMPTFPYQDWFSAIVLLKSTADVYNEVYNSHGFKIENTVKTRGYHG